MIRGRPSMGRVLRAAFAALLGLSLAACSTIQSWFPDKQKEYRYSSEIPVLEIPPDLLGSTPPQPGVNDLPEPEPKSKPEESKPDAGKSSAETEGALAESPIGKYRPAPPGAEASATLSKDSGGAYIAIQAPFPNAWTITEKAINRVRIEIKDKDRSQKVFYVFYSDHAKAFEPSWTDDIMTAFRGSSHRDDVREYRVKLEDAGDALTKVRVLDGGGQAQSQGEGYQLLQAIHQKILVQAQPEPASESGDSKPEDEEREDKDSR